MGKSRWVEPDLWRRGYRTIAGVDEVGRGCLAGPVVAAAIIIPRLPWPRDVLAPTSIRDSKKLTPSERARLYPHILDLCLDWGLAVVDAQIVDLLNVFQASLEAMRTAVCSLKRRADLVLVDGPWRLGGGWPEQPLVGGDDRSLTIGAASIIAKVARDRLMEGYEAVWPRYSFARHKGYGTKGHLREIRLHGLTPLHRRSFSPCREEGD